MRCELIGTVTFCGNSIERTASQLTFWPQARIIQRARCCSADESLQPPTPPDAVAACFLTTIPPALRMMSTFGGNLKTADYNNMLWVSRTPLPARTRLKLLALIKAVRIAGSFWNPQTRDRDVVCAHQNRSHQFWRDLSGTHGHVTVMLFALIRTVPISSGVIFLEPTDI